MSLVPLFLHILYVFVAIAFGDPHVVTLDGHQYTFNGKGEYTYLETIDGSFVSQCRLEQAVDASGLPTQATVFTAIVAKTNTSDVVQMEVVNGNKIEICVNGVVLDFSITSYQSYAGVAVTRRVNGTVSLSFDGGYFMEVGGENDILSLIKVTLPDRERGRTQGLLGNYNGNSSPTSGVQKSLKTCRQRLDWCIYVAAGLVHMKAIILA